MTPGIPLPRDEDLSEEVRATLASLPPFHVFRMMANARASFQPILDLARSILLGSGFDARKREIAVLRVAQVTGSDLLQNPIIAHRLPDQSHESSAHLKCGTP